MPVMDLLNWPMPAGADSEVAQAAEVESPAVEKLRAELAEAQKEIRRLRARVEYLEEQNERLEGPVTERDDQAPAGAEEHVEIFVEDDAVTDTDEDALPLAVTRR